MHDFGAAPSYHLLSSGHRAAYLEWLARGRAGDGVPIGLVLLFCAGLERRVLLDGATDPIAQTEFGVIAAELRRLLDRYGERHQAFRQQAGNLLEVLELLTAPTSWPPPAGRAVPPPVATDGPRWPVPSELRIALAQLANSGRPVPPDWARCWAWYHPSLFPTTPQTRCPEEFTRLFALRYHSRLPSGLIPTSTGRPPVRIGYQPVNPGMDTMVVDRPDLPDVLDEPSATRQLGALADEVTGALTPYSRWLARTPGGRNSVASTVLLPPDLLEAEPGPLRPLMTWADRRLQGSGQAVVDGAEFAPFWSSADPRGMSREEAASLAVVLARIGLGVEPDVRFAGPPLKPGPAVLFRLDAREPGPGTPDQPSADYRSACLLLAVAAATVLANPDPHALAADRSRDATVNRTVTALAAEVRVTVDERTRLSARLRWLLASGVDPVKLRRQAEALNGAERDAGAHFLVRLVTESAPMPAPMPTPMPATRSVPVSAPIGPDVVAPLIRGYRLLGLPEDLLYSRLHHALSRPVDPASPSAPDHSAEPGPVLVRRGRPTAGGHALPWAPALPGPSPTSPTPSTAIPATALPATALPATPAPATPAPAIIAAGAQEATGGRVTLRQAVVGRKIAESETVAALLAGIFTEDSRRTRPTTRPPAPRTPAHPSSQRTPARPPPQPPIWTPPTTRSWFRSQPAPPGRPPSSPSWLRTAGCCRPEPSR